MHMKEILSFYIPFKQQLCIATTDYGHFFALFDSFPLNQFSKFNNFLWLCLRQLSVTLIPRLVSSRLWICLHFVRESSKLFATVGEINQKFLKIVKMYFFSKCFNFHLSSNILIENKNVNKSKVETRRDKTRDQSDR